MEFLTYYSYIVLFLLIFTINQRVASLKVQSEMKVEICKVNQTFNVSDFKYFLKCTLYVSYYKEGDGINQTNFCKSYDLDSDEKSLFTFSQNESLIDQYASCVSNRPIFLQVGYDGYEQVISEDVLKVEWQRKVVEFNDPISYTYEIEIKLHDWISYSRMYNKYYAPKHSVFMADFSDRPIHILWFENDSSLYQFGHKDIFIHATSEIISIPCIYADPTRSALELVNRDTGMNEPVVVDNVSVLYHVAHGFKINSTLFKNWNSRFLCGNNNFSVERPQNFSTTTEYHHTSSIPPDLRLPFVLKSKIIPSTPAMEEIGIYKDVNHKEPQFILTCTSTSDNVTFQFPNAGNYKQVGNGLIDRVIYMFNDKPETMYTATLLNISIPLSEVSNGRVDVNCWNPSNNKTLHSWVFRRSRFSIGTTFPEEGQSPYLYVQENVLQCHSEEAIQIEFRQIECKNRFYCEEYASAVFRSGSDRVIEGEECDNPSDHWAACEVLQILEKGFFQCRLTEYWFNEFEEDVETFHQDIYFRGFDGKLYIGDVEAPEVAILRTGMINQAENHLILPDDLSVFCEAHSFYFEHGILWYFVFQNGTELLIPQQNIYNDTSGNSQSGNSIRTSTIYLWDSSVTQIKCKAPLMSILNGKNLYEWKHFSIDVILEDSIPPTIESSEDLTIKYFRVREKNQFLRCNSSGLPKPKITWTANGKAPEYPLEVGILDPSILQFSVYNATYAGEYVCIAENKAGYANQIFTVYTLAENSSWSLWTTFGISISVCVIVALPVIIFIRRLQNKALLTEEDMKVFIEGTAEGTDDKEKNLAFSLPYDKKYEISEDQFEIDKKKILGKGAFGIVYSGTVSCDYYCGSVAFKTVQPDCDKEKFKALLRELKIMIYIGNHENIIGLIAAYTKDIQNGILYIATELCALGSLEEYLRSIAETLRNDKKKQFEIQNQISVQINTTSSIFTKKILWDWSSQIANGMEYLAFKHVVHSDLATRNILLNANGIAKITDFGLSRQLYNYCNYEKKGDDPLPWKWMAIESLRNGTFSTQSDVWAFGVVLWEIFSLGAVPYPGISWTSEFLEMLENGTRNPKPKLANLQIYNVMQSCWNKNPVDRPSFTNLKTYLMEMNAENVTGDEKEYYESPTPMADGYVRAAQLMFTVDL